MMTTPYIELSEKDTKEVTKELKHLIHAAHSLLDDVVKEQLRQDNTGMMISLLESYQVQVGKILGYETELAKERENRFVEIREKSKRIMELEEQISSSKPIDGLQEQLKYLYDVIDKWWKEEGFYHISDYRYYSSGVVGLKFYFMMDYQYSMQRTSEPGEMNREEYTAYLQGQGYEVIYSKGNGMYLLDTPVNRQLLKKLITTRFPSVRINGYENRNLSRTDEDCIVIFGIDATINSLHDIVIKG